MRLTDFEIIGLYGRFDHRVSLHNEDRITILTAPNGFGKTAVINILHGFFSTNFDIVAKHQFEVASLRFDNGSVVNIRRQQSTLPGISDETLGTLQVELTTPNTDPEQWHYDTRGTLEDRPPVERYLPYLERTGDSFFYGPTGEILTFFEVQQRFGDELPARFRYHSPLTPMLRELIDSIECHLIETQRLLRMKIESRQRPNQGRKTEAVVDQNAADLADKIQAATRTYAIEAQRLDQSFPQRVLRQLPSSAPSEEELRLSLKEIETKRQNLAAAGLVEATFGPLLTDYDKMDEPSVRNVLNLYARDAAKKLETFDSIYARINLFLDIVNDHFVFKKLSVAADVGMTVGDDKGMPIPLTALSSGEQHILVLIYDLLFKVGSNALILVDEPELSLHVAWQKRFISDLQKIQFVQPIDVVVATHSPQIINDRWDLMVELSADDSRLLPASHQID